MKKSVLKIAILAGIVNFGCQCTAQGIFIGPTLHYNFGGPIRTFSYGIEASFWTNVYVDSPIEETGPPWGFDVGFEFEKNKKCLYSDIQIGIPTVGISNGPVVQWTKTKPTKIGYQGSVWLAYFGGVDARIRLFKEEKIFAPGLFIKAPVYFYDQKIYSD